MLKLKLKKFKLNFVPNKAKQTNTKMATELHRALFPAKVRYGWKVKPKGGTVRENIG